MVFELVLVGATNQKYTNKVKEFLENKDFLWTGWTFKIRERWRNYIKKKLTQGPMPLYLYLSKSRGGSGKVEYILWFEDIKVGDAPIPSPDPIHTLDEERDFEEYRPHTWFKVIKVEKLTKPIELSSFIDVDNENGLKPQQLKNSFGYTYAPRDEREEREGEEDEFSISLEKDIQRYLAEHLNEIEDGLTIYSDDEHEGIEYPINAGRIDILAKDKNGNFVVIEIKAKRANKTALAQILSYMGALKEKFGDGIGIRGILVAKDFDNAIIHATKVVPNIELVKYSVFFKFKKEKQ